MSKKGALIVGVGGMCGSNMAQLLHDTGDWDVVGISRTPPQLGTWLRHISVDLLDAAAARNSLADLRGVTHIFYTGLIEGKDLAEENALNTRLFVNALDAALPRSPELEHVHVLEGVKWYGYHLGGYKTPAREDDPPVRPAYFYEFQHDYVLEKQQGRSWTWSTSRPGAVCGYAPAARINLMTVLAVYATMLKALKMPLFFPGDEATFDALTFASDVGLLNRAMLWMSTDPKAADQAFNIGNGDMFRWRYMWPRIAAMFDMEAGPVQPTRLTEFMADKHVVWNELAARHGLRENDFHKLAPWTYADTVFRRNWDNAISTVKANRFGFTEMMDTESMMARIFDEFRQHRIIPNLR
jgi:nucleoside-diphosphate-sugar epimerase